MTSSLYTALSGLQAHQSWIDVIGNNLANANTPGFKTSAATFSDHFSRTLQYASGPSAGLGGRNPVQVGLGVRLADIGRNFAQGALTTTGRTFDLALQGRGFFTVSDGTQNLYTRVGTFGLDSVHDLVDQRTGFRVLDPSGSPVTIDTDSLFAPHATSTMEFTGNLPAVVTGPLSEVLTGASGLKHGSPATLTGTATGPFAIPIGETWTLDVIMSGGAPETVSVTSATGSVTAAEIAAEIDALDEVSASVDVAGHVVVTSDRTGEDVSIKIDPGAAGRDLASLAGLSTVLVTGSEIPVNAATTLNDLPGNVLDYADGDVIHITGVDADGTAVNGTFTYGASGDGETVDEFVTFLDNLYTGSTVELNSAGQIVVTSDTPGESDLLMSFSDDSASTGRTQWSQYALSVTTQGTPSDEVSTSMEVYDPSGVAHTMTFTFERQADGTWNATPTMPTTEGVVLSSTIEGIAFGDDGTPVGLAGIDTTVIVQFAGQSAAQFVELDLGSEGDFGGITQYGTDGELFVREQDGFGVGELASMAVDGSGSVQGFYTNGQTRSLGQIGISTFTNPEGLHQVSDNYFAASTNSGGANLGPGAFAGAGAVVGGTLENSNVDTAEQFVHLIEAQRGFQANARVVTAQDEVLRDTVNLI